ncbi:MAG: hypothetical protein AAF639_10830 [Chloroflexota bacterium]
MTARSHLSDLPTNIASYYPCHFPLINLQMKQRMGSALLSLWPNAQFYSVPALFIELGTPTPALTWFHPTHFFHERIDLFQLSEVETAGFEAGLHQLRSRISCGEIPMITGTVYELPYSPDYHNPLYLEPLIGGGMRSALQDISQFFIADHYVAVINITDDGVTLYDPIPHQFIGTISLDILERFWRGNHQFGAFIGARGYDNLTSYGFLDVLLAEEYQDDTLDDLARSILANVSTTFLSGVTKQTTRRHYFSGVALNAYIQHYFSSHYAETGEAPKTLGKSIFDMRWSHYFLRDFIHDLCDTLDLPLMSERTEVDAIVQQWEQLYTLFFRITRKTFAVRDEQAQHFCTMLEDISATERCFHEKLLNKLQDKI